MNSANIIDGAHQGAKKGATVGLILAVVTILAAITELHTMLGMERVVYYFAAMPLFAFDVVNEAPPLLQWGILVLWWISIGGAVGWAVAKAEGGLYVASVLIVLAVAGHLQTLSDIERELSGNLSTVKSALEDMMIGN